MKKPPPKPPRDTAIPVRCRDCAHCKPTTDGRRYCSLWSHIVPDDGFCWRGEEVES